MAYSLANLQTDIRNYTEVSGGAGTGVLSDDVLARIIKNAEHTILEQLMWMMKDFILLQTVLLEIDT